jgi:hypothetical protein
VRLARLSGRWTGRVLVGWRVSLRCYRFPGCWMTACDGERLRSRRESAWFPGADRRIRRRVPRIFSWIPSMAGTSPGPGQHRSHRVPDPFVAARVSWRAVPARAPHVARRSILLFQRALLPPFLRLLEKALYRACVPTLGSMRRPVVVKIYSGSPDQEQFRDYSRVSRVPLPLTSLRFPEWPTSLLPFPGPSTWYKIETRMVRCKLGKQGSEMGDALEARPVPAS